MRGLGCAFTYFCDGVGLSHIFLSICRDLHTDLDPQLIVPGCAPEYRDRSVVEAVPRPLRRIVLRSPAASRVLTERRLLREARQLTGVYLFPAVTLETIKRLRGKGVPLIMERVNCALETAGPILDDAYRRLGRPAAHGITRVLMAREREELQHVDYVICPSANAYASYVAIGVPESKLIPSSYGWSPARFPDRSVTALPDEPFTVLFVGSVCVRKGAHLLLGAWSRAAVDGQLVLCGDIEPAIVDSCHDLLARGDVLHVPFTRDVGSVYRRAHVFALPTLEEGCPLVTSEAMAHGLPILTSPMGAGDLVRDECEGRVLDPFDEDAWVEALRAARRSPDQCARWGAAARQRAPEFTWDRIARSRGEAIAVRLKASRT